MANVHKMLWICIGFLPFTCCAESEQSHQASSESRIRVFGQNAAFAELYAGSACINRAGGERVSGGMSDAFSSMLGLVSNTSLGIAETETTRNLARNNGLLSKAYFREYVIPAGVPTSLKLGFKDISNFNPGGGSTSASCFGTIAFTPEAGQDYETGFDWHEDVCRLSVKRVVVTDDGVELQPVPVTKAPDC